MTEPAATTATTPAAPVDAEPTAAPSAGRRATTVQQRWAALLHGRDVHVGLADGDDERAVLAGARLATEGLIRPVLIGDAVAIRARARELGVELADDVVWDVRRVLAQESVSGALAAGWSGRSGPLPSGDPLYVGAAAVRAGALSACLGGATRPTADVLRSALRVVGLRPGVRVLSSAFLMLLPSGRALTFSDCAVVPDPDENQLVDIASAAAATHYQLTREVPVVAMLSFSTQGSAEHPHVTKVRSATDRLRSVSRGFVADGELQLDAAVVESVGRRKAPGSTVAGHANVLVFPNLDAGNIGYKIAERFGGAVALGPILQGLNAPINDLSRGCSADDIEVMARISAVQALVAAELEPAAP